MSGIISKLQSILIRNCWNFINFKRKHRFIAIKIIFSILKFEINNIVNKHVNLNLFLNKKDYFHF